MSKPLYVTAKFCIRKEKLSEANDLMQDLMTKTLQNEENCISYVYLKNNNVENEFTSFEIWKDAEAEAKHWATSHIAEALKQLPEMLETEPEITKWNRI